MTDIIFEYKELLASKLEIEQKLKEICDIPIFHDDQHGTAVVCVAACINALKLVGKKWEDVSIVFSGAGAAGEAIAKLMIAMGARDVVMCDSRGIIYKGRKEGMNSAKEEIAEEVSAEMKQILEAEKVSGLPSNLDHLISLGQSEKQKGEE